VSEMTVTARALQGPLSETVKLPKSTESYGTHHRRCTSGQLDRRFFAAISSSSTSRRWSLLCRADWPDLSLCGITSVTFSSGTSWACLKSQVSANSRNEFPNRGPFWNSAVVDRSWSSVAFQRFFVTHRLDYKSNSVYSLQCASCSH